MTSIEGKVALITGASRGIGRTIVLALANVGVHVGVNFHRSQHQADELCQLIADNGGRAVPVQADVSDETDVRCLVAIVQRELGDIGILVNNAGIAETRTIDETTTEDFDLMIRANLRSTFLVTQAALPSMRKHRWGRIIMLSSIAAQTGGSVGLAYAASKAGQLGLMHSYARSLISEGITVNAIAPGPVDTEMAARVLGIDPKSLPIGRFGTPDEIAAVALMLVRTGYITNQTLNVNGGLYPS